MQLERSGIIGLRFFLLKVAFSFSSSLQSTGKISADSLLVTRQSERALAHTKGMSLLSFQDKQRTCM